MIRPSLEVIQLIPDDELAAIKLLQERGIIDGTFDPTRQTLTPVAVTKVAQRQARRAALDQKNRTEAARELHKRGLNPGGRDLDRQRLGKENLFVLKSAIDNHVNAAVGMEAGQRDLFTREQYDHIDANFKQILSDAVREVCGGN